MLKKSDLTIDRTFQGAWRISAIVGGYYETKQFFFYTKAEAIRLFLAEYN